MVEWGKFSKLISVVSGNSGNQTKPSAFREVEVNF